MALHTETKLQLANQKLRARLREANSSIQFLRSEHDRLRKEYDRERRLHETCSANTRMIQEGLQSVMMLTRDGQFDQAIRVLRVLAGQTSSLP